MGPLRCPQRRCLGGLLLQHFVFALGKFPGLKIDRPGAAIIGAVLMVAFRIMTAQEALRAIDFPTIVLLFSMTLIVAHLHLGGFFAWGREPHGPAPERSAAAGGGRIHERRAVRLPGERRGVSRHDAVHRRRHASARPRDIDFLVHLGPVAVVGLCLDWALLHWL